MPAAETPLAVVGAEGCEIELADGRRLIDGMASWWSAIHGYRAPEIMAAVHEQLDRLPHVMFGGLTHEPAATLCRRLVDLAPRSTERHLEKVFLSDSGSVAVEVAMKMAVQYQAGIGRPERARFLTVRGGYHGDTFGAMSVCDPDNGMHTLFRGAVAEQLFAPAPQLECADGSDVAAVADILEAHSGEIAAFIIEPIVQGAGGMRVYRAEYLAEVAAIESQLGVGLSACRGRPGITDVRVKGAIGVIQLSDPSRVSEVQAAVIAQGVWLRPFRDLLYTMPPYVISEAQLARVIDAMVEAATA
jgi:adenosylmethionine-8-amino-7-oxononanoate aminotransferase